MTNNESHGNVTIQPTEKEVESKALGIIGKLKNAILTFQDIATPPREIDDKFNSITNDLEQVKNRIINGEGIDETDDIDFLLKTINDVKILMIQTSDNDLDDDVQIKDKNYEQ